MIQILKACSKEIKDFPDEIKEDLADALARLDEGHSLSMPLPRPMPPSALEFMNYDFGIVRVSIALFILLSVRVIFGCYMPSKRRHKQRLNKTLNSLSKD